MNRAAQAKRPGSPASLPHSPVTFPRPVGSVGINRRAGGLFPAAPPLPPSTDVPCVPLMRPPQMPGAHHRQPPCPCEDGRGWTLTMTGPWRRANGWRSVLGYGRKGFPDMRPTQPRQQARCTSSADGWRTSRLETSRISAVASAANSRASNIIRTFVRFCPSCAILADLSLYHWLRLAQ